MNDAERAHEGRSTTLSLTVEAHDTERRAPRAPVDRESAILQVASNMSSSPSPSDSFFLSTPVPLPAQDPLPCYAILDSL